jgi:YHS domain-containing protein
MFVDVELEVEKPAAITVPADAIIDSGRRKTVYVERSSGMFEPRLVQTGWRLGERVQITNGLQPGERVVVSGNFLIDSESRMKTPEAAGTAQAVGSGQSPVGSRQLAAGNKQGMRSMNPAKSEKDLVCGMDVDPNSANVVKTQYKGQTYYFCSEMCRKNFEENPEKYVHEMAEPDMPGMNMTE